MMRIVLGLWVFSSQAFATSQVEDTDADLANLLQHQHKTSKKEQSVTPAPLCVTVAAACCMDWSDGVPAGFANWDALEEAFSMCCEAGGHEASMCASVAHEAFEIVASEDFAESLLDEAFCHELDSLVNAHDDWRTMQAVDPVDHALIQKKMVKRLMKIQSTDPGMFKHFVQMGMGPTSGAATLALSQVSQSAAHAAIETAVASHLRSCQDSR